MIGRLSRYSNRRGVAGASGKMKRTWESESGEKRVLDSADEDGFSFRFTDDFHFFLSSSRYRVPMKH